MRSNGQPDADERVPAAFASLTGSSAASASAADLVSGAEGSGRDDVIVCDLTRRPTSLHGQKAAANQRDPPAGRLRVVGIVAWIIVGLLAGGVARWIVRDDRTGCLYTMVVGVLGALIGGALMQASGRKGVTEFDLRSVLVSAVGAVLLLLVLQALSGRGGRRRRLRR